jgi:signal transduction histidine kinase
MLRIHKNEARVFWGLVLLTLVLSLVSFQSSLNLINGSLEEVWVDRSLLDMAALESHKQQLLTAADGKSDNAAVNDIIAQQSKLLLQCRLRQLNDFERRQDELFAKHTWFTLSLLGLCWLFWMLRIYMRRRNEIDLVRRRLLQMIGHDLKTPMSTIQVSMHLLESGVYGALPQRAREVVDSMLRENQRLLALISDVLDIAKAEAGVLRLNKSTHAAQDIFDAAMVSLTPLQEEKKISLQLGGGELLVHADYNRIVQVLFNLLSNAIRHSPEGSTILVDCTRDGLSMRFSVCDQGSGIKEPDLNRLFYEFHQGASNQGSAGLGLAICRTIIEAHGGTIAAVNNVPPPGCRFSFSLPEPKGGSVAAISSPVKAGAMGSDLGQEVAAEENSLEASDKAKMS